MRYRYDLQRGGAALPMLTGTSRRALFSTIAESFASKRLQGSIDVYRVALDGNDELYRTFIGTLDRAGFHRRVDDPQLTLFDAT